MREYCTASEEETIALGGRLASELPLAGVVLLTGNLGAGKTTLAKGIVSVRTGVSPDEVGSPTFTLIHEYGTGPFVYHIDLYRLNEPSEVIALGLDELIERGLCLIEWGERFPQLWEHPCREIRLTGTADTSRTITVGELTEHM